MFPVTVSGSSIFPVFFLTFLPTVIHLDGSGNNRNDDKDNNEPLPPRNIAKEAKIKLQHSLFSKVMPKGYIG